MVATFTMFDNESHIAKRHVHRSVPIKFALYLCRQLRKAGGSKADNVVIEYLSPDFNSCRPAKGPSYSN